MSSSGIPAARAASPQSPAASRHSARAPAARASHSVLRRTRRTSAGPRRVRLVQTVGRQLASVVAQRRLRPAKEGSSCPCPASNSTNPGAEIERRPDQLSVVVPQLCSEPHDRAQGEAIMQPAPSMSSSSPSVAARLHLGEVGERRQREDAQAAPRLRDALQTAGGRGRRLRYFVRSKDGCAHVAPHSARTGSAWDAGARETARVSAPPARPCGRDRRRTRRRICSTTSGSSDVAGRSSSCAPHAGWSTAASPQCGRPVEAHAGSSRRASCGGSRVTSAGPATEAPSESSAPSLSSQQVSAHHGLREWESRSPRWCDCRAAAAESPSAAERPPLPFSAYFGATRTLRRLLADAHPEMRARVQSAVVLARSWIRPPPRHTAERAPRRTASTAERLATSTWRSVFTRVCRSARRRRGQWRGLNW